MLTSNIIIFLDDAFQILQECHHFLSKFRKHTQVFNHMTMIAERSCSAFGIMSSSWSIISSSVTSNSSSWVPMISAMMLAVVKQRHRNHFHEIIFALVTTAQKKRTDVLNAQIFKSCIRRPAQHVNIRMFKMMKTQNWGKSLKFYLNLQENSSWSQNL